MLNAAVRVAPYTASGTPLASFSAGRLVRRLTHTLTYDGGGYLCAVQLAWGLTHAPLHVGGEAPPPPILRPAQRQLAWGSTHAAVHMGERTPLPPISTQCRGSCHMWGGLDSSQQDLPPTPLKGGVFFLSTIWAQEASVCAAKTHSRGPNKHLPVFSPKMAVIYPNFPEENKGGGGHTNLQIALPAKFLNFLE